MSDRQLIVRVPKELHKSVAHLAIQQECSMSKLVTKAIEEYLKKEGNG